MIDVANAVLFDPHLTCAEAMIAARKPVVCIQIAQKRFHATKLRPKTHWNYTPRVYCLIPVLT